MYKDSVHTSQGTQSVSPLERRNFECCVGKHSLFIVWIVTPKYNLLAESSFFIFVFTAIESSIDFCVLCQRVPDLKYVLFASLKFVCKIFLYFKYYMN